MNIISYLKSFEILRKKFIDMLQIFLYDAGFFISIILFAILMSAIVPNSDSAIESLFINTTGVFIFLIIYIIALIAIYSAFKLLIINIIASAEKHEKISFENYSNFFILNIIIFFILAIIGIILSWIRLGLKQNTSSAGTIIILIIFLYVAFLFVQESHRAFLKFRNVWVSLKNASKELPNIRKHSHLLWSLILLAVYFLITIFISYVLSSFMNTPYRYTTITRIATPVFSILSIAFIYIVFTVSRYNIFRLGFRR